MKRTATQLFKRLSKNRAFFPKLSNFYFDLIPRANPRARQRSENLTPGATRMCESTGVAWGGGGGWSGLELTDTQYSCLCFKFRTTLCLNYKLGFLSFVVNNGI